MNNMDRSTRLDGLCLELGSLRWSDVLSGDDGLHVFHDYVQFSFPVRLGVRDHKGSVFVLFQGRRRIWHVHVAFGSFLEATVKKDEQH